MNVGFRNIVLQSPLLEVFRGDETTTNHGWSYLLLRRLNRGLGYLESPYSRGTEPEVIGEGKREVGTTGGSEMKVVGPFRETTDSHIFRLSMSSIKKTRDLKETRIRKL